MATGLPSFLRPAAPPSREAGGAVATGAAATPQSMDAGRGIPGQSDLPRTPRDWAVALRRPVESCLEDLRQQPRRAAQLFGPVLDAALVENRRTRMERLQEEGWQWLAVLSNPRLWRTSLKALWEGEGVWDYIERQAGWYQVVEAMLMDSSTQAVIGRAEAPWRRHFPGEQSLLDVLSGTQDKDGPSAFDSKINEEPDRPTQEVLVLMGVQCRLAVRVCGTVPPTLRPALHGLCQEADSALERTFTDVRTRASMIERLLHRALMKNSPVQAPWSINTALVAGVLATLVVMGLLISYGLKERQWQKALEALNEEPGLQVVGESTSWGRRELRGLKDPGAREPSVILAENGVDPADVVLKFKTYLSSEAGYTSAVPIMLPPKPRRVSGATPSVLEPEKDKAKPVAPPVTDSSAPPVPPKAVPAEPASAPPAPAAPAPAPKPKDELPASLKSRQERIESVMLRFKDASEEMDDPSTTALTQLCEELNMLKTKAAAHEHHLRVTLLMRHTATAARGVLWQLRQNSVRDALTKAGFDLIDAGVAVPPQPDPTITGLDALSLRIHLEPDAPPPP